MSTKEPQTTADRAAVEARGLWRALMPHEQNNTGQKLITMTLVAVWGAITIGLAFDGVAVSRPPYYGIFTAIVFLIIGRIWNIEVERLLPGDLRDEGNDK